MSKVLRMLWVEVGLVERAVVVLAHLTETFSLALTQAVLNIHGTLAISQPCEKEHQASAECGWPSLTATVIKATVAVSDGGGRETSTRPDPHVQYANRTAGIQKDILTCGCLD